MGAPTGDDTEMRSLDWVMLVVYGMPIGSLILGITVGLWWLFIRFLYELWPWKRRKRIWRFL